MRTIKFRGEYTETGEWRYGYYARLSNEFKEWHCIMTEKDAAPINAPTQEWAEVIGNIHDNPKLLNRKK